MKCCDPRIQTFLYILFRSISNKSRDHCHVEVTYQQRKVHHGNCALIDPVHTRATSPINEQ
jgi:hypothetical protein